MNNKWGFIDKQGNIVIPFQFDVVYSNFENGYAEVWIGREYYLIDKQGNIVAKVERGEISYINRDKKCLLLTSEATTLAATVGQQSGH